MYFQVIVSHLFERDGKNKVRGGGMNGVYTNSGCMPRHSP